MKRQVKDGNEEGMQLDAEIWQRLPQEILERVIAKLPFSRAVALRTVCKEWYSDIIPHAAVQDHLEASSGSSLLYFYSHLERSQASAWWLQIYDAKSKRSGSVKEFQPKSFPEPRNGEFVQLLICERGLLFFGFIEREGKGQKGRAYGPMKMRDIVVCNPLISKSKSLGLPFPLQAPSLRRGYWGGWSSVVGATFDSETGGYCFVCAGVGEGGQDVTFLYDSLTSTWTNGSPLSPFLLEISSSSGRFYKSSPRSICCKGNLYWHMYGLNQEYLLKFDTQDFSWSLIHNPSPPCEDSFCDSGHSAVSKGEILIWHLHFNPILSMDGPPQVLSCEVPDRHLVKPPQYIDWPCRSENVEKLDPGIKLMPHHMMEKIYQFFYTREWLGDSVAGDEYKAFNQQNFIYHVVVGPLGLAVLVHNINNNLSTELRTVPHERLPASYFCSPDNVWSFSASLTSLP